MGRRRSALTVPAGIGPAVAWDLLLLEESHHGRHGSVWKTARRRVRLVSVVGVSVGLLSFRWVWYWCVPEVSVIGGPFAIPIPGRGSWGWVHRAVCCWRIAS